MNIQFFHIDVKKFIFSLEEYTIAKVLRTIDLLEQFGNNLGMPHSKKVALGVWELRIRGSQEVRLLYTFSHNTAVILHGFVKKSQHLPRKELKLAQARKGALDKV